MQLIVNVNAERFSQHWQQCRAAHDTRVRKEAERELGIDRARLPLVYDVWYCWLAVKSEAWGQSRPSEGKRWSRPRRAPVAPSTTSAVCRTSRSCSVIVTPGRTTPPTWCVPMELGTGGPPTCTPPWWPSTAWSCRWPWLWTWPSSSRCSSTVSCTQSSTSWSSFSASTIWCGLGHRSWCSDRSKTLSLFSARWEPSC